MNEVIKINDQLVKEAHFEYGGRDCIVVFQYEGFRCGYVSLKKSEEVFREYEILGERRKEIDYGAFNVSCHGGLTYGGGLIQELSPTAEWYVGFDCSHFCDGNDFKTAKFYGLKPYPLSWFYNPNGIVLSLEQCIQECKSIADQLNKQLEEK